LSLLITIGWLAASATTTGEQTALDDMKASLTGLPASWVTGSSLTACTNTVDWSNLTCDIANTITGINLSGVGVIGNIPSSFSAANLANVSTINFTNNGLFTGDNAVDSYIDGIQSGWKDTQVVAPTSVSATALTFESVLVLWVKDPAYGNSLTYSYDVYSTLTPGTGYTLEGTTTDTGLAVSGLFPNTTYYFIVNATASGNPVNVASAEVSAMTLIPEGGGGGSDETTTTKEACYIATAAYGSYLDPHVQALRDFRDDVLLKSAIGRELVDLYYRTSPPLAQFISKHEGARTFSRIVLTPVVFGVAFPGLTFAMAFGMGILGGVWVRKRRSRKARSY
jgi:hypothetical protein